MRSRIFIWVSVFCVFSPVNRLILFWLQFFCWLLVFILLIKGSLFMKEMSPVSHPCVVNGSSRFVLISPLSASPSAACCWVQWDGGGASPCHTSPVALSAVLDSPAPCVCLPCTGHTLRASPSLYRGPLWAFMLDFYLHFIPLDLPFTFLYSFVVASPMIDFFLKHVFSAMFRGLGRTAGWSECSSCHLDWSSSPLILT